MNFSSTLFTYCDIEIDDSFDINTVHFVLNTYQYAD